MLQNKQLSISVSLRAHYLTRSRDFERQSILTVSFNGKNNKVLFYGKQFYDKTVVWVLEPYQLTKLLICCLIELPLIS